VFLVDIRSAAQREAEGAIHGSLIIERNVLEWRFDPRSNSRRRPMLTLLPVLMGLLKQAGLPVDSGVLMPIRGSLRLLNFLFIFNVETFPPPQSYPHQRRPNSASIYRNGYLPVETNSFHIMKCLSTKARRISCARFHSQGSHRTSHITQGRDDKVHVYTICEMTECRLRHEFTKRYEIETGHRFQSYRSVGRVALA